MDLVAFSQNQWAKHSNAAKRHYRRLLDRFPLLEYSVWFLRGLTPPTPAAVKRRILLRFGLTNSTWVETGTYKGETTEFLAKLGSKVFSIEPDRALFSSATGRLSHLGNVQIVNGTSEDILPTLLPSLSGPLSFWLDGHHSGDGTFLGGSVSPIAEELDAISKFRKPGSSLVVLVDDVRLFKECCSGYPTFDFLVHWAEGEALSWRVKHDVFIASSSLFKKGPLRGP